MHRLLYVDILVLSVPKFSANMYCICLSIPQIYTSADAVQICGKLWDTQYIAVVFCVLILQNQIKKWKRKYTFMWNTDVTVLAYADTQMWRRWIWFGHGFKIGKNDWLYKKTTKTKDRNFGREKESER